MTTPAVTPAVTTPTATPVTLTRVDRWPRQLGRVILLTRRRPFAWGKFDCGLFAADCIRAMTGHDFAASLRGKYTTEAEAMTLLGTDLGSYAASLGLPEVTRTHARRGDLVLIRNGDPNHALGIVGLDPRYALCAGAKGLVKFPLQRWIRAWRVGS